MVIHTMERILRYARVMLVKVIAGVNRKEGLDRERVKRDRETMLDTMDQVVGDQEEVVV